MLGDDSMEGLSGMIGDDSADEDPARFAEIKEIIKEGKKASASCVIFPFTRFCVANVPDSIVA